MTAFRPCFRPPVRFRRGAPRRGWRLAVLLVVLVGAEVRSEENAERAPQRVTPRRTRRVLGITGATDSTRPSVPRKAGAPGTRLRAPNRGLEKRSRGEASSHRRPIVTMAGSLALAVGAFLVVVWGIRRAQPASAGKLPPDVLETLGRMPLAGRLSLQLVRLGNKLVLLSVSPEGAEALAEVTDPQQVAHLAGLCRGTSEGGIQRSFQQVIEEMTNRKRGL